MAEFSGHLFLSAARRDHGRTVLAEQAFRAPYHISKPYWDADAGALLVQVVNPTAGILAGDRLDLRIAVLPMASLLVTAPSASRLFQMGHGNAECRQHFLVSPGAWLEVMSEPLVPHRGTRYRQVTTIEVEKGGALFYVDQLTAGRISHGEAWQWERLCLELTVRVSGDLVLRERFDQTGDQLRSAAQRAGSGPAACFANAVLIGAVVSDNAPDPWAAELATLHGDGLWLGASRLRRGGWSIKVIARDGVRLRQALSDTRRILARYFPRLVCDPRKL